MGSTIFMLKAQAQPIFLQLIVPILEWHPLLFPQNKLHRIVHTPMLELHLKEDGSLFYPHEMEWYSISFHLCNECISCFLRLFNK